MKIHSTTNVNNEFFEKAFTDEKNMIIKTLVANKGNYCEEYFGNDKVVITPARYVDGGNDTEDKIFLLSNEEVNRYFHSGVESYPINSHNERLATKCTTYVQNKNKDKMVPGYWFSNNSGFWLRSPGENQHYAGCIAANGSHNSWGININALCGVRPVIWIKY